MSSLEHEMIGKDVEKLQCANYDKFDEEVFGLINLSDLYYLHIFAIGYLKLWEYGNYQEKDKRNSG